MSAELNTSNSYSVITSMNKTYYDRIGSKMISSFLKFWPNNITLKILTEEPPFIEELNPRVSFINLYEVEPEMKKFHNLCSSRDDYYDLKTSLKKGAFRFSFKSFAIISGCQSSKTDYTIWLDADLITHSNVDKEFFQLFDNENIFSYFLGRANTYTETGFLVFKTSSEITQVFFDTWRSLYSSSLIFEQKEWHDCICYDFCRENVNSENKNLTPYGKDYDNVIVNSIIAKYFDHLKGDTRKKLGSSFSSDVLDTTASIYSHNLSKKSLLINLKVKIIKLLNLIYFKRKL